MSSVQLRVMPPIEISIWATLVPLNVVTMRLVVGSGEMGSGGAPVPATEKLVTLITLPLSG
jgi:hypothetical protein